jgi:hypothetical protein
MAHEIPKSKYPPIKGIGTLIREGEIQLVRIDRTVFKKTAKEKAKVKAIRLNYKNGIT